MNSSRGFDVHFLAKITDLHNHVNQGLHLLLCRDVGQFRPIPRKFLNCQRMAVMRQTLPEFLGNERHEGMQQTQGLIEYEDQEVAGEIRLPILVLVGNLRFDKLDIPVAKLVPEKVPQLLCGFVKAEFFRA